MFRLCAGTSQPHPYAGQKADTIYIGGGTPSIFSAKAMGDILRQLRQTSSYAVLNT